MPNFHETLKRGDIIKFRQRVGMQRLVVLNINSFFTPNPGRSIPSIRVRLTHDSSPEHLAIGKVLECGYDMLNNYHSRGAMEVVGWMPLPAEELPNDPEP